MITPDWVRLMAAYNAEMNRRIYAAADQTAFLSRMPRFIRWHLRQRKGSRCASTASGVSSAR